jgi:large subunit ribosomal protein L3
LDYSGESTSFDTIRNTADAPSYFVAVLEFSMKAILGTKVGMTHIFDEGGNRLPVTVIECAPNVITARKTTEKDGYEAVQIGFGTSKRLTKAQQGHLKAAKSESKHLKELREADTELYGDIGKTVDVGIFAKGDSVDVTGTSKGKGFAGTIKRHNFSRGPMSHGSHNKRRPGSIGAGYPEHVFKGMKMAGQMGAAQVTAKGLTIAGVDAAKNALLIKGAVPGPNRGVVMVKGL